MTKTDHSSRIDTEVKAVREQYAEEEAEATEAEIAERNAALDVPLNLRITKDLDALLEDVPSLVELRWRSEVNSMRRLRQFRGSRPSCLGERGGAGR